MTTPPNSSQPVPDGFSMRPESEGVPVPRTAFQDAASTPMYRPNSSLSVDRTRAIVEAAQAFGVAMNFDRSRKHEDCVTKGRAEEACAALARALALPEPEWTTEWPKVDGLYFARLHDKPDRSQMGDAKLVYVCAEFTADGVTIEPSFCEATYWGVPADEGRTREALDLSGADVEFWPVRVTPPPA